MGKHFYDVIICLSHTVVIHVIQTIVIIHIRHWTNPDTVGCYTHHWDMIYCTTLKPILDQNCRSIHLSP